MQLIRASPPSPVNFLLHGLYFFLYLFFFYRGILKPTHIVAEPMESADQCDQVRLLSECKAHDVLCEPISVWTRPVATTSTVPGMSGGRERHLFLILRRLAEPASVHLRVCLPQWSPLLSHPSPTPLLPSPSSPLPGPFFLCVRVIVRLFPCACGVCMRLCVCFTVHSGVCV